SVESYQATTESRRHGAGRRDDFGSNNLDFSDFSYQRISGESYILAPPTNHEGTEALSRQKHLVFALSRICCCAVSRPRGHMMHLPQSKVPQRGNLSQPRPSEASAWARERAQSNR